MYFIKHTHVNYLFFIFVTCNINTVPPADWSLFFTSNRVVFMFLSSVADKQCFSGGGGGGTSCCVPYFHPTLPSDVPTLQSNRVVKQSLKQPLCYIGSSILHRGSDVG